MELGVRHPAEPIVVGEDPFVRERRGVGALKNLTSAIPARDGEGAHRGVGVPRERHALVREALAGEIAVGVVSQGRRNEARIADARRVATVIVAQGVRVPLDVDGA